MSVPKTALVTGASRGIGRQVAIHLARLGFDLTLTARDPGGLEETGRVAGQFGVRIVIAPGDATSPERVEGIVSHAKREMGSIGVLVNNAGRSGSNREVWAADVDEWWSVLEINLRGPMLFMRHAVPVMIQEGAGYIFNMNSLAGQRKPLPGFAAYAVSKAALSRLTEALLVDVGSDTIRAFDVSPGLVKTDMTDIEFFAGVPEDRWTSIGRIGDLIEELLTGRYDILSGTFIHAEDDLDLLLRAATADARRLRLTPIEPKDPLLDEG